MLRLIYLIALVLLVGDLTAAPPAASRDSVAALAFLKQHCFDCHDQHTQEGGLRLDNVSASFDTQTAVANWHQILKRLKSGEMPPERVERPDPAMSAKTVSWIERNVIEAEQHRQRTDGRVALRRLNRTEYQNTVNDLFATNVDVKDMLPEDTSAHGFDNIGDALTISSVLLERYLEAADVVLDAAIVTEERPTSVSGRYSYKDERRVKDHKSYKRVDDALVFFSSGYSPTEINQFRAPAEGTYRIRISAYAHQSDQPVTYRVYAEHGGAKHLAGYFEAGVKPSVAEFTTQLGFRKTIRVVPLGTYLHRWAKAAEETGAGLAVQWVEIEGPLIDQWPPESHQRLFGSMPIEIINADAIKRNRRIEPLREVVSSDAARDAKTILKTWLPRIFRRPVDQATISPYVAITQAHLDQGYTFQQAVRVGLKAALCSPEFLYVERRVPSPSPGKVDGFQLASRLSYFLWSTMPDRELLNHAANGTLADPKVLREQTERMLSDPRARALTRNFVGQWLNLREIDFTTPDKLLYPEFDELLQISMVKETELFFEHLLQHDLSILNFIDSDFAMLNGRLAKHYNIDGVHGLAFRKVVLPEGSQRGGVLTHASVLKVTSNGTNTSPVLRGVWILDKILGQASPPPPANVPAVEPDIRGAVSIRDQLAKHRSDSACSRCHNKIDPLGNALENFDVIGGWQEHYRSLGEGQRVDVEVNGRGVRYKRGLAVNAADRMANGDAFENVKQFKALLLRDKEQITRCLTEKLLTYATGAGIQIADQGVVDQLVDDVAAQNRGLRSLIHLVVQSSIFQMK